MRRTQVDKYLGFKVAITFDDSWFNEANGQWVQDDEEYIGIINRCDGCNQEKFYQLDSETPLATNYACWGAKRIKKIRLLEEVLL